MTSFSNSTAINAANDNRPVTFDEYVDALPVEANKGRCINAIANDSDPHVLRNVALYYEQREETWADALAGKLRSAARPAGASKAEFRRAA